MAFTPLNALNAFLAVARHRSFAAGARHLGISTSALSQSVRQLEARLGTLRLVLEPYAAAVPGLFLYFPSRSQVSPAFRAFVDVARELVARPATRATPGGARRAP
jgi:DNA-binding transcriptional LysR family regulator